MIGTRFEKYWRRSARSWSDTAARESARSSGVVFRPMMWHRRFAWPPSWRCRATAIAAARSWPSCTASPRTRWPTRTARPAAICPIPRSPFRTTGHAEPGPEQAAIDADSVARMSELLDVLPDKQREILILRVVVGLSAEETAAGRRQHRGGGASSPTPRIGAVEIRDRRSGARLCLNDLPHHLISLIRTRSRAASGSSTRWPTVSRSTRR